MARLGRQRTQGGNTMSEHSRSYNSFSGADIKAMFAGVAFTELQALSYSIEREKAGIWTLGQVSPRSFSRGKRGIAGTFIAINFDRNALLDVFDYTGGYFMSDIDDIRPDFKNPDDLLSFRLYAAGALESNGVIDPEAYGQSTYANQYITNSDAGVTLPDATTRAAFQESAVGNPYDDQMISKVWMADQIMPFNIAVAAANEYGAAAAMKIYGVEILNETSGFSVDDMVIETHWTFVAREIGPWQPSSMSQSNAAFLYERNNTV